MVLLFLLARDASYVFVNLWFSYKTGRMNTALRARHAWGKLRCLEESLDVSRKVFSLYSGTEATYCWFMELLHYLFFIFMIHWSKSSHHEMEIHMLNILENQMIQKHFDTLKVMFDFIFLLISLICSYCCWNFSKKFYQWCWSLFVKMIQKIQNIFMICILMLCYVRAQKIYL